MPVSKQNGLAYDLSLFEPEPASSPSYSPEKKPEISTKPQKQKVIKIISDPYDIPVRRLKDHPFAIAFSIGMIILAVVGVFVLRNYVTINELNDQIHAANVELANQENLEAQYQLRIDRKLTDEFVKEYAETKLGMTQANSAQKEFVSLTDGDKGEVLRGDGKESFIDRIMKAFRP